MIVRGVTLETLAQAAESAGVAFKNGNSPEAMTRSRLSWRFTLAPVGGLYQRRGPVNNRRIHAVCWHGHLAFFRALYALAPRAKVRTTMASYDSLAALEAKKDRSYQRPITTAYFGPVLYGWACACESD